MRISRLRLYTVSAILVLSCSAVTAQAVCKRIKVALSIAAAIADNGAQNADSRRTRQRKPAVTVVVKPPAAGVGSEHRTDRSEQAGTHAGKALEYSIPGRYRCPAQRPLSGRENTALDTSPARWTRTAQPIETDPRQPATNGGWHDAPARGARQRYRHTAWAN